MTLRARPTTYRGIQMRSRLEAKYAAKWDSLGIQWAYEPRAYASPAGQYLPDFEFLAMEGRPTAHPHFVEVKGAFEEEVIEEAMERMEIIWESVPDAVLHMVFGDGHPSLYTHGRRWEILPVERDAA